MITARDYNWNAHNKEVIAFHAELEVHEMHYNINHISVTEFDKTCIHSSSPVHSTTTVLRIAEDTEKHK